MLDFRMRLYASVLVLLGVLAGLPLPARAETTVLEVAYLPMLSNAPLFVIEGEGWAREAGIELELTSFSSGPAMVQALASGRFDAAYLGIGPIMVARAHGLDFKVLAASGRAPVCLIGRGELASFFAAERDPAAAFAAFAASRGRPARIATLPRGSVPDIILRYWLAEIGHVPDSAVEILGVSEDRVQQLLLTGAVDAGSINEPTLTLVHEHDAGARILATGDAMFPDQPGAVLAVRERTIAASPQVVEALVRLHIRATRLIGDDPARAARAVEAMIGRGLVGLDTVLAAMRSPAMQPAADPHRISEAAGRLQEFARRLGVLDQPVAMNELFDMRFFDGANGDLPGAGMAAP
jgi:NitT/TauT family transport system substrate-binding protein